jgi:hypothetical protein
MDADDLNTLAHASAGQRLKLLLAKSKWPQKIVVLIAIICFAFASYWFGFNVGQEDARKTLITEAGTAALGKLDNSYKTLIILSNDIQRLHLSAEQESALLQTVSALKDDNSQVWKVLATIVYFTNPDAELERHLSNLRIGSAYAQNNPRPPLSSLAPRKLSEELRIWIMLIIFLTLALTFLVSIISIFKSTNPDVLKFAFDTVKTLLGFFIGVATTLIGTG